MSGRPGRAGLSIFLRTFLLLAGALVVSLGSAVALMLFAPVQRGDTELMHVVALLSSDMPSGDGALQVHRSAARPALPGGDAFVPYPDVQAGIARWLNLDADAVVFAATRPLSHRRGGPPPRPGDGRRGVAWPEDSPPPPPPRDRDCEPDCAPPAHRGDEDRFGPGAAAPSRAASGEQGGPAPDALLRGDFIAAARQADGSWRVVESSSRTTMSRVGRQVALFFLGGLLVLLPLALSFSRALAAPIREFARAADHLGRDPRAAPLPLQGPREIIRAAESFNTMQTRLNRMVAERTQMLGAIAHDLRTPLARLAFRLDKLPGSDQEKAQADIGEMTAMIAAALDLLRDQSMDAPRGPLDLRSLVENVVDGLADTGQNVVLEPGPSATVDGDPVALRRLVTNLVDNALKYGRRARLRLLLDRDACRLEVDDDGPGVDPAQAEQLFTPFFRGEASRNRGTGGIGLGLSVVQDVATRHGGDVMLANRAEGGLRATLVLPTM